MKTEEKLNMTMLCDFYELTMGNGYFEAGYKDRITYFDVFFRKVPDGGGFAIAAGLEQLIDYIENLHFTEEDIAYLRGRKLFCEEFLDYLRDFRFTGDIYAIPEGTPVFLKEPLVIVRAPAIEAQLIETFTLLTINHQSLIATKANRITRAAKGRTVLEFGSRRAQGADAAIIGARAAYIGGCAGRPVPSPTRSTACRQAAQWPMRGCRCSTTNMTRLRRTADLSHQRHAAGRHLQHAEVRRAQRHQGVQRGAQAAGHYQVRHPAGLRRPGLSDTEGPGDAGRGGLDGVQDLRVQLAGRVPHPGYAAPGAQIDLFGVGERMITAKSEPVFGGVYKLVAVEEPDGTVLPKIKVSENVEKITVPHFKRVYRLYGRDTGKPSRTISPCTMRRWTTARI